MSLWLKPTKDQMILPSRYVMVGAKLALTLVVSAWTLGFAVPHSAEAQSRQQRCFQLEAQLNRIQSGRSVRRTNASKIRAQLRRVNSQYRRAQARVNRANCYSTFFFTQSLKNTPRCRNLARAERRLKQQRARLQQQLNGASRPVNRHAERDRVIRALARNRCGAQYQRAARRTQKNQGWNPFKSLFGDQYFDNAPRQLPPEENIRIGSTYRTMCVRQCDGYYYPVSFSTLPSRFQRDASRCASSCAAPTELYVYRNPGAEVEQMVSLDGRAYSKLPNAFRYRKEYIKGCTCKVAEYDPLAGTKQAQDAAVEGTVQGADGQAGAPEVGGSSGARPVPPRVAPGEEIDNAAQASEEAALDVPPPSRPVPPKPSSLASASDAE